MVIFKTLILFFKSNWVKVKLSTTAFARSIFINIQ